VDRTTLKFEGDASIGLEPQLLSLTHSVLLCTHEDGLPAIDVLLSFNEFSNGFNRELNRAIVKPICGNQ
jgi:hypothetical protein